jgi:PTS system nitrogen regulatory IIA component
MERDYREVLRNGPIILELKSDTKEGVIEEMIDRLVAAGQLKDKAAALQCVLEREEKMSTGMQFGVAVPHGKTATMEDMAVAFAIKPEGVEFDSLDGEPSRIFVMTISTPNRTGPHIHYLAEISKLLASEAVRRRLLAAKTAEDVVATLSGNG